MSARPIIAVIPFGARALATAPGAPSRAGAWARQIARRLVERGRGDETLELRPVFLVAMPEETTGEGHLIFGSAPPPDLAAQYGASLGASHVVTGTYDERAGRRLTVRIVDVATHGVLAERGFGIAAGQLHRVEGDVGAWIESSDGAHATTTATPSQPNEPA